MKYKYCSRPIRINVTRYDVTFATRGALTSQPPPVTAPLYCIIFYYKNNYTF